MLKIKLSNLNIAGVVMRFYFMMLVGLLLGFAGQWILMAFVAGTIGATAIMGMSFEWISPKDAKTTSGKIIQLDWGTELKKAS